MSTPTVTVLDDLANLLLAIAADSLGGDAPAQQYTKAGPPVWELCTTDQLVVWFQRLRPSGPLTATNPGPHTKQVATVADFGIAVVRCVASMDDKGRPPPPAEQSADALQVHRDARLLWWGLAEAQHTGELLDACQAITFTGCRVDGPSGGKAATVMDVQVQP